MSNDKTMADVIDLKKIVVTVLSNHANDDIRKDEVKTQIAQEIYTMYVNVVKEISVKFLENEVKKRSTLQTFEGLINKPKTTIN